MLDDHRPEEQGQWPETKKKGTGAFFLNPEREKHMTNIRKNAVFTDAELIS